MCSDNQVKSPSSGNDADSDARCELPREPSSRRSFAWWLRGFAAPLLFFLCGVLLIAALGLAQRIGWISAGGGGATAVADNEQVFTCPMHPQIRQPSPGRCPICGMALVAASAPGADDLDELSVRIEPAQRRLANIETAEAKRGPVSATIQTVGAVAIDESRISTISSYVDGRLERLFADYTGVEVAKNDHLAVVYSPDLYTAQVEYLEIRRAVGKLTSSALASVREAQQRLVGSSRQRLAELGMSAEQLKLLDSTEKAKSRLTIYAPTGGTVIEKMALEGKYVKAGEPIYRIAELSTVWLVLELYPEDAARIRYGQRVEAEMQSLPGEVFNGRVAFIDRQVDPRKRTVGVRVEFLNNDGDLRPGDYANATIYLPIGQRGEVYDAQLAGRWISPMHPQIISDKPGQCSICGMDLVPASRYGYAPRPVKQPTSLYVPRSALLMAGASSVVYVEVEEGRFEIRAVTLGPILRDKVIILSGLEQGEKVATAGNFLIDSQMQLAGKPSLIDPTRAIAAQKIRKSPLKFVDIQVAGIGGQAGVQLEALFVAYFQIQSALASDQKPPAIQAENLHQMALSLLNQKEFPTSAKHQLKLIAKHSEHIHHMELEKARHEAFRPLSHAVVALATEARGAGARQRFQHMFCPMVVGGAGDWLQPTDKLLNPYYGSKMLRCGRVVQEFPAGPSNAAPNDQPPGLRPEDPSTSNASPSEPPGKAVGLPSSPSVEERR